MPTTIYEGCACCQPCITICGHCVPAVLEAAVQSAGDENCPCFTLTVIPIEYDEILEEWRGSGPAPGDCDGSTAFVQMACFNGDLDVAVNCIGFAEKDSEGFIDVEEQSVFMDSEDPFQATVAFTMANGCCDNGFGDGEVGVVLTPPE